MKLRRRRRAEAELAELIHRELAATRATVHADVADAVTRLEGRARLEIERREQTTSALLGMLARARAELATADVDTMSSLELVAKVCEGMLTHLEAERAARAELVDAIRHLAGPFPGGRPVDAAPRAHQVIGGTIGPAVPAAVRGDAAPHDRAGDAAPHDRTLDGARDGALDRTRDGTEDTGGAGAVVHLAGVQVRCRFDRGGWVGGFEVAEVFTDNGRTQYQLRRSPDGYVLPRLFDECDVRNVDVAPMPLRHRDD